MNNKFKQTNLLSLATIILGFAVSTLVTPVKADLVFTSDLHEYSNPRSLANVSGQLVFSLKTNATGEELWLSDGSQDGTKLIKDINPGVENSYPSEIVSLNGTVIFVADNGVHGAELWKSDRTQAGTQLLKDINPGSDGSFPYQLTRVGNLIFFIADKGDFDYELWKTDGSAAGTVMVKDIYPGTTSSNPAYLVNHQGKLYFAADDGVHGHELWTSDGSSSGTQLVKDISPNMDSGSPSDLVSVNGSIYFSAYQESTGTELWKSDGTASGTQFVKDIYPGTDSFSFANGSFPGDFQSLGDAVYFRAENGDGAELWKTDGTATGTTLVKDVFPGTDMFSDPNSSYPTGLMTLGDMLYFSATDDHGTELWRSDGSAVGTELVEDLFEGMSMYGPNSSFPSQLTNINGVLYFTATTDNQTQSLYRVELGDLFSLSTNYSISDLVSVGGIGFYGVPGGETTGPAQNDELRRVYEHIQYDGPHPSFEDQSETIFNDVVDHPFYDPIHNIATLGITRGCGDGNYCPDSIITRGQMAVFILRAISTDGPNVYSPPAAKGTIFNDVPATHPFASWIEEFLGQGITKGCGVNIFCPEGEITRAQMAVFLLRLRHGSDYQPPVATGKVFADIPQNYPAAAWIEQFSKEGITGGCGGGNYCPEQGVTRGQMAAFFNRMFNYPDDLYSFNPLGG